MLGKRNEQAKVFTLCRSLSEYLTSTLHEPQLVTRARSDRQKRNRAFAAEFLVPADALRKELPTKIVNDEDIDDLAIEFGVSSALVRHQLANHDLARVATT